MNVTCALYSEIYRKPQIVRKSETTQHFLKYWSLTKPVKYVGFLLSAFRLIFWAGL